MLGVTFSMDETSIHFKFNHADRIRTMFKSECDELQTYAIFHKGYTYQIFICNNPLSKKFLVKRLPPLDARAMAKIWLM